MFISHTAINNSGRRPFRKINPKYGLFGRIVRCIYYEYRVNLWVNCFILYSTITCIVI